MKTKRGGLSSTVFKTMKRCQGLTLDKVNQVDKNLSPMSHLIVNDIKFP